MRNKSINILPEEIIMFRTMFNKFNKEW